MPVEHAKQNVYDLLAEKGIPYEVLEHEAVFTMEDMDKAGITSKGTVCKNLFLRDAKGKNHFLVTVPEEKKVDLGDLAGQLYSSKLSFASPERLEKYLGVVQGSVSPLGILNDANHEVTVVFDKDLCNDPAVGVHPNDNTATIWLAFKDLQKIIKDHGNAVEFVKLKK